MTKFAPRLALSALALLLAACTQPVPETQRRASTDVALPAMKVFAAPIVQPTHEANPDLARDFLDLSFALESGRGLGQFTRFEGPVHLTLSGRVPPSVGPDLDKLVARLRSEAGIDISRGGGGESGGGGTITVEFLSRAALQAVVPNAACFVVPNVTSWADFRHARNARRIDWTGISQREQVSVFVPNDTSPQEMRDCLHEEIAQALGPLNDLYRLPDSVFNDDNFNTVLTGFDMMMLRLTYAPELHSGMSQAQVAAVLPRLLARINPNGFGAGSGPASDTPRAWIAALESALGGKSGSAQRYEAARRAVAMAQGLGWRDNRLAFSLFMLGRLSVNRDVTTAEQSFAEARALYQSIPGSAVHLAHVDMQLAAFALKNGHADQALTLVNDSLMPVAGSENAALLATLLMLKSEALAELGRISEARAVRLDSLGWARYGFGPEAEVRDRMSEIALLTSARH